MNLHPGFQSLQRSTGLDCTREKVPIRGKATMTHVGEKAEHGVVLVGPGEGVDDGGEGREGGVGEGVEYEVGDLGEAEVVGVK